MREHDLLHLRTHFGLLHARLVLLPVTIKSCPAHSRDPAQGLDAAVRLWLHHSDLLVDAVSPAALLCWPRASILRKAPRKKSTSTTLPAKACFNR
jgi:hypothetical protein